MNLSDFDIDQTLSNLLKNNISFKFTKLNKKTYDELINYTIELEIKNCDLEKKIETVKSENFKSKQLNIDLALELEEYLLIINNLKNDLKFYQHADSKRNIPEESSKNLKSKDIENLSITQSSIEELSLDNDLIKDSLNERKEVSISKELSRLREDNYVLVNDVNLCLEKNKILANRIDEKDNIINLLYQELENINNLESKDNFKQENKETVNSHLNDLEFIKASLVDFLKHFGIQEENSNFNNYHQSNNKAYLIQTKMQEIKYILHNLKKIEVIFKTLIMEFSENIYNMMNNYVSNYIESKFDRLELKFNKLSNFFKEKLI